MLPFFLRRVLFHGVLSLIPPSLPALCQLQTFSLHKELVHSFPLLLLSLISKDYGEAQLGWVIRVTLTALLACLCP